MAHIVKNRNVSHETIRSEAKTACSQRENVGILCKTQQKSGFLGETDGYERLGLFLGRSLAETTSHVLRILKNQYSCSEKVSVYIPLRENDSKSKYKELRKGFF